MMSVPSSLPTHTTGAFTYRPPFSSRGPDAMTRRQAEHPETPTLPWRSVGVHMRGRPAGHRGSGRPLTSVLLSPSAARTAWYRSAVAATTGSTSSAPAQALCSERSTPASGTASSYDRTGAGLSSGRCHRCPACLPLSAAGRVTGSQPRQTRAGYRPSLTRVIVIALPHCSCLARKACTSTP